MDVLVKKFISFERKCDMIETVKGKIRMKFPIWGRFRSVFAVALMFVMAFCLTGCDLFDPNGKGHGNGDKPSDLLYEAIAEEDFLRAEGELVKNKKGETVILRGVNAGGLFVTENWMNGFRYLNATEDSPQVRDFRSISKVFNDRFGLAKTQDLWKAYQENWWSDIDFENCAAMGMNCIRLPFTYMTVDFDTVESYDNAGDYDFSMLDAFIQNAASYGMYTILDMHGAYGSQNGQDHSGEEMDNVTEVGFYTDQRMIGLTVDLWSALAEHYKDEPAVAGYDILNEPGEKAGLTTENHFAVFDKIYDAIREKDKDHIVIFESCWDGKDLPMPSRYGWENCMYSFHHYTSMSSGGQFTQHGQSWNEKIEGITKMNFGVPIYMGEFNNYNDPEQWTYVLELLNRLGWHWTSWTYKLNNTWGNSAWGIYLVIVERESDKVNARTDDYETILKKFSLLKTTEQTQKVDLGGRTLEDIMKEYCSAPMQTPLDAGEYKFYDSVTGHVLFADGTIPQLTVDRNAGQSVRVTYHSFGDGSVYLSMNGRYFTVAREGIRLGQESTASRFFPVQTEYGYAFVSCETCRYLRFDDAGRLHADGVTLDDSAIFITER